MRKASLSLLLASLLFAPWCMAEESVSQTVLSPAHQPANANELAELKRQVENSEQDSVLINRLRQENQRLKLQLKQALAQPANARLLSDEQMWFATGAGVAVLAFALGMLSSGRRNKRQSQWV